MDFIDLASQQRRIADTLQAGITRVLAHGQYINGPEVAELEQRLAAYVGVRNAVGCASGTDALLMALMALEIGPGDAVFTTPFTFVATAEVISLLGATPVFVDIDPVTFNLDPVQLERAIAAVERSDPSLHPLPKAATGWRDTCPEMVGTDPAGCGCGRGDAGFRRTAQGRSGGEIGALSPYLRPRAVIAVDLFGLPADYDAIEAVAGRHGLDVIEDAAQSFGGECRGRKAGAFGRIACTSFFPAKPLGCYGDGGMCFTDDDRLAELLRSIRVHGQGRDRYDNVRIGINGRLDTIQAAVLLAKFSIFADEVERRQEVAERYDRLLGASIKTPVIPDGYKSAWAQYSLLARDGDERALLIAGLHAGGVPTAIYYPKPLHLQGAFASLGYGAGCSIPAGHVFRAGEEGRRDAAVFPVSEDCAGRIFSLPMHPYLQAPAQEKIAALLQGPC